jgi:hypothetical protein
MRVKDVIRAKKRVTDWGAWERSKKAGKSTFPLSKSGNSLVFGLSYAWRLIKFETATSKFRLLLAVNHHKQEYYAVLGLEGGKDMVYLASLEYHGTHLGWHIHAACGDIDQIPVGRYQGDWKRRLPKAREYHRRQSFVSDDNQALAVAVEFFGLNNASDSKGQLPLL